MKSVIAIAVMIACRAAFAWAHCDIPMLSFCLPRKEETQASTETPGPGISFLYRGPVGDANSGEEDDSKNGAGEAIVKKESLSAHGRRMPQVSAADISLYDALTLICNAAGCRWEIYDVGFILVTNGSNVSD